MLNTTQRDPLHKEKIRYAQVVTTVLVVGAASLLLPETSVKKVQGKTNMDVKRLLEDPKPAESLAENNTIQERKNFTE